MSLRDQLVAKGFATEKQAKRIDRELKADRKQRAGQRASRAQREREQAERDASELAARQAQEERNRLQREGDAAARATHELRFRVKQIIDRNRLGARGPQRFYYRVGTTPTIARLMVSESLLRELRAGRAAIACYAEPDGRWVCAPVSHRAAEKLAEVAPSALVHWTPEREGLDDPANAPAQRDWDADLRARRAT